MKKSISILMLTTALLITACSSDRACHMGKCSKHQDSTYTECSKTPAYFAFDSSMLDQEDKVNLNKIAKKMKHNPHEKIVIHGFTDNIGPKTYNLILSEHRAKSAAQYLESQGIAKNRIQTKGLGATDFAYSNDTESGRAKNRRIEVEFKK